MSTLEVPATEIEENSDVEKSQGVKSDSFKALFLSYIRDVVDNRLKHPVLGAIIIAFVLYNWQKILLVIFPVSNPDKPLSTLGDRVFATKIEGNDVYLPVIAGIIYPLALSYSSWLYNYLIKFARVGMKAIKEEENQYKHVREMKKRIKSLEQDLKSRNDSLNEKSSTMKRVINTKDDYLKQLEKANRIINYIEEELSSSSDIQGVEIAKYINAQKLIAKKEHLKRNIHQTKMYYDDSYRDEFYNSQRDEDHDGYDEMDALHENEQELNSIEQELQSLFPIVEKINAKIDKNKSKQEQD